METLDKCGDAQHVYANLNFPVDALVGWKMQVLRIWASLLALAAMCLTVPVGGAEPGQALRFTRDIRPILADACFACHGPDESRREGQLRLDTRDGLFSSPNEVAVVVPGKPDSSELIRRITSDDPDLIMPPPSSGVSLSQTQRDKLRAWIAQGAVWEEHWAFVAPREPPRPSVRRASWPRNPIDPFVLARLEEVGRQPSPEADRATLIRRVTLDLTGLPPTTDEVAAFVSDSAPDAYERLVDRLLQSPRYGEHLAVGWLDAARYADTSGYQSDGPRDMWRWRDWVIEAFNRDLPFDQFTVEQLAGDLLPQPSLDQRIATGFNRNHRGNAEGGIVPEEYAVEYVVDRIETMSTVWLGLTSGCARCHDHKYDPLTRRDFYGLFAYFNNIPEFGRAIKEGNSPPFIPAPTREDQRRQAELDRRLHAAETLVSVIAPQLDEAQRRWESEGVIPAEADHSVTDGLVARFPLDGERDEATAPGDSESTLRPQHDPVSFGPGVLGRAAQFEGQGGLEAAAAGNFGYFDRFSLTAWVNVPPNTSGTLMCRMTDVKRGDGYAVTLVDGHLHVSLVKRWLDDAIRVQTRQQVPVDRWHHVAVTYDGSRRAAGVNVFVDGAIQDLQVDLDLLNQTFSTTEPFRIGAGGGAEGRLRGQMDDVRIYSRHLPVDECQLLAARETIAEIVKIPPEQRTSGQAIKLRHYFLAHHADRSARQAFAERDSLRRQRAALIESFPTVMVMEELPQPRPAFLLIRGQYDKPGEPVSRGVPRFLAPLPADAPANRLGLARWLTSAEHPLTARVTVNRIWQQFFGTGLVKTTEDFGTQGEPPSHPELLDWLANEFRRPSVARDASAERSTDDLSGTAWSVKRLQRLIATSATYRQISAVPADAYAQDPENRLLGRGPRVRLSAEAIRDQALALSGLLVEKVGGPSVKPYQPEDLWKELATDSNYVPDPGAGLYRRSLYTFWKRTVSPPTMNTFDAAGREFCQVRRTPTNTPLQSLALLNDVTYVEAARKLAERILHESGKSSDQRAAYGFYLVTARRPRPAELEVLVASLTDHLATYRDDPAAAARLLAMGHSPRDPSLPADEVAACTVLASVLLNLDEVITKQ